MKAILKEIRALYFKVINTLIMKKNNVEYKENIKINGIVSISNQGKISFGNNLRINSGIKYNPIGGNTKLSIHIGKDAKLTIGNNCAMSNVAFCCKKEINIKNNVYIGGDCRIYDTDFHSIKLENRIQSNDPDIRTERVVIEDGAFIGASCIILKGVRIGQNSVIGAGSVIARDVPPNQVWAGNPAKYIKNI